MFRLRITGDLGFEFWMDIPGYEGLYQSSTYGRIRSLLSGKVLKWQCGGRRRNYYCGSLRKDNKTIPVRLHRLIANTFIPNYYALECVNHKDENTLNNRVENLEWCTVSYNNKYGTALERNKETNSTKHILQYDIDGNFIKEWLGSRDIERVEGYKRRSISNCCNNKPKFKTAYGYIWKFKE